MTALQLDDCTHEFRHEAGPLAWFVLEELAFKAVRDGARLIVHTSVRDLAATVSLNKDTVARAVATLVRLGAVEHHQGAAGGRFGAGRYALTLPNGVALLDSDTTPRSRPTRSHATTHSPAHPPAQLTLLDLGTDDRPPTPARTSTESPQPPDALAPGVSRRPVPRSRDRNGIAGSGSPGGDGAGVRPVGPC